MSIDKKYQQLIFDVMDSGEVIQSRNSEVKRLFGYTIEMDMTPLISARKTAYKNSLREMQWFLHPDGDIHRLHPAVRKWWKPWLTGDYVKNSYSKQFKSYTDHLFDQIKYLIDSINADPYSRRHVITTWNTEEMARKETLLTNCHGTVIQCCVQPDGTLDLMMYQRSADVILGLPHNLFQYWAFLMWLCHRTNKKVGKLTWIGGDIHIYAPHYDIAEKIINADISQIDTPQVKYLPSNSEFMAEDFQIDRPYLPVLTESPQMIV